MTDVVNFELSPSFINRILNNEFGTPDRAYNDYSIYVGLGIEFDEDTFSFSKEPVSKGFTILQNAVIFEEPINGILRNSSALEWPKVRSSSRRKRKKPIGTIALHNTERTSSCFGLYYLANRAMPL